MGGLGDNYAVPAGLLVTLVIAVALGLRIMEDAVAYAPERHPCHWLCGPWYTWFPVVFAVTLLGSIALGVLLRKAL